MTKKLPTYKSSSVVGATAGAVVFGALVGGTAAAAKGIRQIKEGEADKNQVALNVAREAGATAVAAGTATAVVSALGLGPILSVLGIAAVATGTKYAMDAALAPAAPKPAAVPFPSGKTAAATPKAAAKKSTAKKSTAKKTSAKKSSAPKKTAAPKAAKKSTAKTSAKSAPVKTDSKTDADKA